MSVYDSKPKAYVAGPFFNPMQVTRMQEIETIIEKLNCPFFSPRIHGRTIQKGDDESVLDETFAMDHHEIERCDFMIANLDFLLLPDTGLYLLNPKSGFQKQLYLPDPGTIWEMGAAYQYGKPILGIKTLGDQLNLMLARCCICVTRDIVSLSKAVEMFVPAVVSRDPKLYAATVAKVHIEYGWNGSEAG